MTRFYSLTVERPWLFDGLCLLLGALLPLAFAPLHLFPLAWFVPALLIPLWSHPALKRVFWRGFLFGLGFFGVGISWVFVSIHFYGHTSLVLAAFLTFLFVAALALVPATQALVYRLLFPKLSFIGWCIGFALIWTLWEWIRGTLFTGFPWLYLAYSQIDSPLAGFIPLLGVYGTTAITVMLGAFITYALFYATQHRVLATSLAVSLLISGFALSFISWTTPVGEAKSFSLIQGNIPQENKWDRQFVESIIQRYVSLTKQHWDSAFIIWPEAALPVPLPDAAPILAGLDKEAKAHHSTLIMGALEYTNTRDRFYNAVVAVGEDGGLYHKQHLVPFGEYIPFENQLRNIIQFFNLPSSYTMAGKANQAPLVNGDWRIAPLICYEIAYASLAREAAELGNVILTVSNDTWFGRSWGPLQHLQIAQFRALETGRYVVRATNSGYTAIINHQGNITARIDPFITDVLTAKVEMTEGFTPITRLGHGVIILLLAGLLFGTVITSKRSLRGNPHQIT